MGLQNPLEPGQKLPLTILAAAQMKIKHDVAPRMTVLPQPGASVAPSPIMHLDRHWRFIRLDVTGRQELGPTRRGRAERAAVHVVLLAQGLEAEAVPQVLLEQAAYFGVAAPFPR